MTNYLKPIETKVINGKTFNIFRSENNMMIRKVGTEEIYSEAIDLDFVDNRYIETDIPINEKIRGD